MDIPSIIVQGRYDMICPPGTAELIHRLWPPESSYGVKSRSCNVGAAITAALVRQLNNLRLGLLFF